MRAQEQHAPEPLPVMALMVLRAEMEALAAVLPGLWQVPQDDLTETEVEEQFDNLPV